jgi:TolA-binding protein
VAQQTETSEEAETASEEQQADVEQTASGQAAPDESPSRQEESAEKEGSQKKEGSEETSTPPEMPEGSGVSPTADVPDEAMEAYRQAYERYSNEIQDYQATIDSIVSAEYSQRRSKINARYDRRTEQMTEAERQRRLEAIEEFEAFLDRYPNHPQYTPDAMFRLAELYFEKENDDYLRADERYQREMERYRAGRRPSAPQAPQKDYTETIATFSELVSEWPDYRLLDGAYYLLAYCNDQMGNARKARDLFAELIVKRPQSEFVPEAWIRIGEYHFDRSDNPAEIKLARQAYEQAMKYEESRFFDKALYKLAWADYRLDNFEKAIEEFKRLVEYSDRMKRETGQSGSVLRAEAVKYVAVSLAEDDWNLDRKVDENFGLPRVKKYLDGEGDYQREVMTQLVDYLFENERFDVAVNVIQYALEQYPKHRKNPRLHERMITALMRQQKTRDQAFEERRVLIDRYGPESDWYAYQKKQGHEEALEYSDNLIRENLIQAATWYHENAQDKMDQARVKQNAEMLSTARQRYAKAAEAYKRFLKRYPNDKDIYRWNFYYAETLYYSQQYADAYEQYKVVRELDIEDNKFQATSAFNAVKSLEYRIRDLVEKGELPSQVMPGQNREEARETAQQQQKTPEQEGSGQQGQGTEVEPESIPDLVKRYITAMDRYVVLQLEYEDQKALDPKFAFNAAKLYYDFKHFDTARERFEWIVDNYPEREEAYLAGSLILETYRQEKNYDMLAKWATRLEGVLKGEQAEAVREEVREFKLGAMFKTAEQLFSNEKYEKAAAEYVKLVNQAPDHENAPRALNNAAVAYENISKYESAMELYQRVYREYPDSPLAGYALYRVGVNSERYFDFDNAIKTYNLFYDKFEGESPPELQKMGFEVPEKRARALLNSAVLAENLQRYEESARRYEQYVSEYADREDAHLAQWQAAESWRKADRPDRMVEALRAYRNNYGAKKDRTERVLEGMMRIAEHHVNDGDTDEAVEMYNAIIKEFQKRGSPTGTDAAYYAAEAQFRLAERDYAEWSDITIDGSLDEQKAKLEKKVQGQKDVAAEYRKVFNYKNLEWTLAAGFRLGSLFQGFAESLYQVPIPFEPGTERYNIYRTQLEDIAIPLEDKAVERYAQTIKRAREAKVVNKWTKQALEELNKYRPEEYPLYKEAREAAQRTIVTGRPLLSEVPTIETETGFEEDGGGMEGGGASDQEGGSSRNDSNSNDSGGSTDSGTNEKGES